MEHIKNLKQHILNSAKCIAEKDGIGKINMRLVASESGIALGTIYNYYKTKGDIIADIITEFWRLAFAEIDFPTLFKLEFEDALEQVYDKLLNYLNSFKQNWLEQLAMLSPNEKSIGKIKEREYLERVKAAILISLEHNENVVANYTDEEREKLAEYIFENIMIMLRKNEHDFSFFKRILKIILNNNIGGNIYASNNGDTF